MALGGRLWNLLLCPLFYYVVLFGYVMFAKSFIKQPRQDLSRPTTSPTTTTTTIHHRRQGTRAQQSHRRFDLSTHPPRPLTNGHKCPPSASCPRVLTTTRLDSNSTKGEERPPTTSRVPTTTFDEGRQAPIHDSCTVTGTSHVTPPQGRACRSLAATSPCNVMQGRQRGQQTMDGRWRRYAEDDQRPHTTTIDEARRAPTHQFVSAAPPSMNGDERPLPHEGPHECGTTMTTRTSSSLVYIGYSKYPPPLTLSLPPNPLHHSLPPFLSPSLSAVPPSLHSLPLCTPSLSAIPPSPFPHSLLPPSLTPVPPPSLLSPLPHSHPLPFP
ncbi:uncharacterized protein LACBIDRAFT_329558 [Laccaria bicolor S238N-H82]|uniref:Predicted protein n=1 Tax=Laccaria bicolor (strain S238N-H82 / ATCC MYA-4686) TaxID=486041 RepID=B0DIE7_LACBS|nr:uncharacterized protein LACBIDRAFT_329558 [Laccaria bicolor S238N-H82]EDR05552.1 predicted protein [Laccaria bicolor S238N-H82]|eukprot:XP_001883656.1 predicted protein [Laccaria bicolor S238N-H82]